MDLWVVAAAAGAGYIAKHWQNILKDKEDTLEFTSGRSLDSLPNETQSPSIIERIRDKTRPIKKVSRKRADIGKGDNSGVILYETSRGEGPLGGKSTNCSTLNHEQEFGRNEDSSLLYQSVFSPEFRNGNGVDDDMSGIPEDSTWEMGAPSNKSRKSRRLHLKCIMPRNSLDSCLMAQTHRENVELEEYLRTPLSSPCTPSLRPFLVSDGKRIISRPSGEYMDELYTKVHSKEDSVVVGVPRLPLNIADDFSKQKLRFKSRMGKSHYSSNMLQKNTLEGFSSGQARFCLGISIGILCTIIANKVELEKLKVSLKQSENLVEDLQEELEMKDSLTVKELVNDDDSHDIQGTLSGNEKTGDEESMCLKKTESISNIEAELEAELERLELSMKGSTLSSELNQGFDQDIIAELVHGELQADILRERSSSEGAVDDSHSTPTPHSAKDGVSPRDLSMRLHEVIQSRLEYRIMELEAELAKSEKHVKHLLSKRSNSMQEISKSGSSSSRCSPRATEPLIMNLSGDALDDYNDAFKELNKIKRSEDEGSQIRADGQRTKDGQTGFCNGLIGKREEAVPISITGIPSSEDSPNDCFDGDDGDGDGDGDDMFLIMQIVEKARQGSPAILKAQKAMVSLNRDH